tara:strand:- start:73 stop:351 length:279 start_codon:yes stop_codon:yes gene_type:complete
LNNEAYFNPNGEKGYTPQYQLTYWITKKIADLLSKHGGKTGEELKAAGNLTKLFHHLIDFGLSLQTGQIVCGQMRAEITYFHFLNFPLVSSV